MAPAHFRTHAVLAVLGFEMLPVAEIYQRIQVFNRDEINAATFAAVSSVRAAEFNILFAAERNASASAVS